LKLLRLAILTTAAYSERERDGGEKRERGCEGERWGGRERNGVRERERKSKGVREISTHRH